MPTNVEIEVFNIGRTVVDPGEVSRWMEYIGAKDFDQYPPRVTSPAFLIALAAKRCYLSFEPGLNSNVSRVRSDYMQYFDNILSSGHGSVLEHAVYSYAIEGVSRVFTAEMNRHRAGWAISEGSLRFIRLDKDIPYWMPLSLRENLNDDPDLAGRKFTSRHLFNWIFERTEEAYKDLLKIWDMEEGDKNFDYKKKVTSCLRRIVPMGVATGGVWTGNIRALRHVLALRTDPSAEEEIAHVFTKIGNDIVTREPMLFQDFHQEFPGENRGPWIPAHRKV
jgi:thymidylate synthase (FAD)